MDETENNRQERFDPLALRDQARESYEQSCALARKAIESKSLVELDRACLAFDAVKLSWRAGHMRVLPLPEAARAGWQEGVAYLAGKGCDPNKSDDGRAGYRGGEAPLAEAVSRGDYAMSDLLSRLGASAKPLRDMVWAASFSASRRGVDAGLEALSWLRSKGLSEWASDEVAKRSQSCYLFAGSLGAKTWSSSDRERWEAALFDGADLALAGARECAWHMLFGGVGSSPDAGEWLAQRYIGLSTDPKSCALDLLRWGFEGAPCLVREGLAVLGPFESAQSFAALRAASGQPPSTRGMSSSVASLESKSFDLAWAKYGEAWLASGMDLSDAAARALSNGRMGLGAGLLAVGANPAEIAKNWRAMGVGFYAGEGEDGQRRKDGLSAILLAAKAPEEAWAQFKPWMDKAFPQGLASALALAENAAISDTIGLGEKKSGMRL